MLATLALFDPLAAQLYALGRNRPCNDGQNGHYQMMDGRTLVSTAFAVSVGGALLVSGLQVWSGSAALPLEYLGRPIAAALVAAPLLMRRAWARWPTLVVGAATSLWLVRSAATSPLLPGSAAVAVGAAGLAVLGALLVPWHPAARAYLRRPAAGSGRNAHAA